MSAASRSHGRGTRPRRGRPDEPTRKSRVQGKPAPDRQSKRFRGPLLLRGRAVAGADDECYGVCLGFPFPWQPDVVVPGEWAMVLRKRTCPSWCASAQLAWPLVRPGRMRMRRAAHSAGQSSGQPSSRSTAKPSLLASQHRESHRPGGTCRDCAASLCAGKRLPVCLGQVPDVRDAALVTTAVVLLIVFGGPAVSLLARIGKDLDAFSSRLTCRPAARHAAYPLTKGGTWYPG